MNFWLSVIIYIHSQPQFRSSNKRQPIFGKIYYWKKNLIEIDLTHGRLEKTLLYTFAFPHLPQKSQLSWDFIKTKTIGVTKKERIKMLKFSLTVFLCFYPRKKKWTRQHFQYSAREVYKLVEKKILKRAREKICAREKK